MVTLLLVISFARVAEAANLTLAWDSPSDSVTTGYIIFYGTASRSYSQQINSGPVTSYTVTGLTAGTTYYFVVCAYSATGALSSPSTEISGTAPADPGTRTNVALASNGAVAVASSSYSAGYGPEGAINGDRSGRSWGNGGGWNDGTPNLFPDTLEIQFSGAKTINEIDLFSVQDNYQNPADPTLAMTFTLYGVRNFNIQYWTGTGWQNVNG